MALSEIPAVRPEFLFTSDADAIKGAPSPERR
jgi:hypothetical protein